MKKIIISAAVLIAAVSCQEAIIVDKADGAIAVNINASAAVEVLTKTDGEAGSGSNTGSGEANTVSPDDFAVYVKYGQNVIKSYAKYSDITGPITVPAGSYVVSAENISVHDSFKSADNPTDPWGQVRYAGESGLLDVEVGPDPTPCSFTCTMANTAVSIAFSDNIKYHFSEIKVVVSTENSRSLDYTTSTTEKVGYFLPETLNYTFIGKYLDETTPMSITGSRSLEAATHLHLTFDISEQIGSVGKPTIVVDATCTDLNRTIMVDPSDGSFIEENVTE